MALTVAAVAISVYRLSLSLGGVPWNRLYFGSDTHCDGLLAGCAIAMLPKTFRIHTVVFSTACWLLVYQLLNTAFRVPTLSLLLSLNALFTAIIILGVVSGEGRYGNLAPRFVLRSAILRNLPVSHSVSWLTDCCTLDVQGYAIPLMDICVSVAVAEVSYRCIEQPFLRLKEFGSRPDKQSGESPKVLDPVLDQVT